MSAIFYVYEDNFPVVSRQLGQLFLQSVPQSYDLLPVALRAEDAAWSSSLMARL